MRCVNRGASLRQSEEQEEEEEVSQGHQHAGGGAGRGSGGLTWRQRETRGVGRAVGCPAVAGDPPAPSPAELRPPTSPRCRGKRDPWATCSLAETHCPQGHHHCSRDPPKATSSPIPPKLSHLVRAPRAVPVQEQGCL